MQLKFSGAYTSNSYTQFSNRVQRQNTLFSGSGQPALPAGSFTSYPTSVAFLNAQGRGDLREDDLTVTRMFGTLPPTDEMHNYYVLLGRATSEELQYVDYVPELLKRAIESGDSVIYIDDFLQRMAKIGGRPLPDTVSRVHGYFRIQQGAIFYGNGLQPALPGGRTRPAMNGTKYSDDNGNTWNPVHDEIQVRPGMKLRFPSDNPNLELIVDI